MAPTSLSITVMIRVELTNPKTAVATLPIRSRSLRAIPPSRVASSTRPTGRSIRIRHSASRQLRHTSLIRSMS